MSSVELLSNRTEGALDFTPSRC